MKWHRKNHVRVALATALFCTIMVGCESLRPHVPNNTGDINAGPQGAAGFDHSGHNYVLKDLVGDELGPTGGYLIAAAPEKFDQHKHQEAIEASRRAEQSPTTVADARNATTADLNGDGYVTLDEVVALKRAGLSDAEIVNRMRSTDQIFSLTAEQERYLTDHGISHDVVNNIRAMSKPSDAMIAGASTKPTTRP